ncbi:MAG: NADase-type glycan-binding domain-containing protein, partial [Chitinivibrionales bacterium]
VGGIAGWNKGLINLCYAAGQLSGGKSIGGIVGENVSDSVKASFWSEGIATGIGSGTGQSLDSARSRKKSTYTSKGWDFDSSWSIDAEINSGLPYLKHVPFVSANNYQGDSIHPHLIRKSEVKCITSSSVYSGKHKYSPENIMDGNLSTAWIEGVAGNGEEQWVEIEFTQPQDIQEIIIVNGYTKSFRIYAANNRVKNLLITATTESGRIERNIALRNVSFHGAMPVAGERVAGFEGIVKVRFQIKSIYKGSKYEDTGISEVLFLKG